MTDAIFSTGGNANSDFDIACEETVRGGFIVNIYIIDPNGTHHAYGGSGSNNSLVSLEWTDVASPNNGFYLGTFSTNELRVKFSFPTRTPFPSADFGDSIIGCQMYASIETVRQFYPDPTPPVVGYPAVVPLGAYIITDVDVTNDGRDYDITAYATVKGLSDKLNLDDLGLTLPTNYGRLLRAIFSHFNLLSGISASDMTYLDSVPVREAFDGTYADYIGWGAGLLGCNARLSRNITNNVTYMAQTVMFVKYTEVNYTIQRWNQHLDGVHKKYDGAVTYTTMVSGTEDNPIYPVNRSGNAIVCLNPYMQRGRLNTLANDILGNDGLTVIPCSVTWRGNPRIDACDVIKVKNPDNTTFLLYVMEHTVTISGGLRDVSHSYANTEENVALTTSPLDTRFQQVNNAIDSAITNLEDEIADTYLPLTGGNVGSLTVNNSPVITEDTSHLKTYTVVTQLGLTMGYATIVDVWNAMPNGSFFMGNAGEFVSTEVPHSQGQVYIGKNSASRQGVWYFPKQLSNGVWVMGADSAGTPDDTWIRLDPHPVGSVIVTSTNTNPSATYGGTWTLIDKEFKVLEVDTTNYTDYFTPDANTTVSVMRMHRTGHAVHIFRFAFTYGVALTDTTVTFGVLNLNALGISSIPNAIYCTANSDGGNGIAMTQISTAGDLASIDVITKTSGGNIPAGVAIGLGMASIDLLPSQMDDSACDKFYWKRTA